MRVKQVSLAITLAFALSPSLAHERDIYDKCETTLRLCFQRCIDRKNDAKTCNMDCNTSSCESISGREKPLTEFLKWNSTKGKIWL